MWLHGTSMATGVLTFLLLAFRRFASPMGQVRPWCSAASRWLFTHLHVSIMGCILLSMRALLLVRQEYAPFAKGCSKYERWGVVRWALAFSS
ncbi:hypothetical protein BC826DRAFT_1088660 [Russula brevipes]|nr:hypothetical protein BC826DRAFT_1088660 [Russula brevipes]